MIARIDGALAPLLEPGRPVALVNYANHPNPGDNAIWLGTLRTLRRLNVPVGYTSTWTAFSENAMRRAIGGGTLLLNGGGNFGDLYAGQEDLREALLARCTDRRIVQLPQSIWFRSSSRLERARRLCAAHPNFVLMVRERQSAELAVDRLGIPAVLCPDLAFGMGAMHRAAPAERGAQWIVRSDREAIPRALPEGVAASDWIADDPADGFWPGERDLLQLNRALIAFVGRDERRAEVRAKALSGTFEPLANAWVRRGAAMVSSAGTLVTDRLHVHVFAILLGIPHVVLDNSYGKLRSTFETWTSESGLAAWADDARAALDAVTA
ncbi:MAG TPA: polysaccharide pyruvyl transferase family protein [Candidatus Limnocylindrales bacterium]|nr:polysaccharide pyruvyl transferase family protein [Candidatus Limnocylindrales bacterium]